MSIVVAVVKEFLSNEGTFFSLVQTYHSSRVLTLVYQPFAVGTLAVLAYNEAKMNTRRRNLFGYILFFISTLLVLVVSTIFFLNQYVPMYS